MVAAIGTYLFFIAHPRLSLPAHKDGVHAVAFSPDGKLLASCGGDPKVQIWDMLSGKLLATFKKHNNDVSCLAFSPDGKNLASGSYLGGELVVWDMATRNPVLVLSDKSNCWAKSVAFSQDKGMLAVSWNEGAVILDPNSGEILAKLIGHRLVVDTVVFLADGKTLGTASLDGTLVLWNVKTWKKRLTLKAHQDSVDCFAVCQDNRKLVTCGSAGGKLKISELKVWDIPSRSERTLYRGNSLDLVSVALDPQGRTIAAGGIDGDINIWEADSGKRLRSFRQGTGVVRALAFSPDGRALASGCDGGNATGKVLLWDLP
jgi:WD40 repeat protein